MNELDELLEAIESSEDVRSPIIVLDVKKAKKLFRAYRDLQRECDQLRNELASARCSQYH